jgi:hypothetical protein
MINIAYSKTFYQLQRFFNVEYDQRNIRHCELFY